MAEEAGLTELPDVLAQFAQEYPEVWSAYNRLGSATAEAGPLDEKTQRLIKLAIAIGAQRQGAVHSHTRRALAAGLTREELTHVARGPAPAADRCAVESAAPPPGDLHDRMAGRLRRDLLGPRHHRPPPGAGMRALAAALPENR